MGKRKAGKRTTKGRLSRAKGEAPDPRLAWDYGNDVTQARRRLFDCAAIKGGKAADQVSDGIGQLWALDLLEGHEVAGDALRDAGRLYAELYWACYARTAATIGNYDRRSRTSESGEIRPATPRELAFERMDDCLPRKSFEWGAVHSLVIDEWHSDRVAPWAESLICEELLGRGRIPAATMFPTSNDRELLAAATRGLLMLALGQRVRRQRAA